MLRPLETTHNIFFSYLGVSNICHHHHHHHHHQSLNCEGRWGTTDDFSTSLLHFPLFSTFVWDLPNSRPIHSVMLSSHLFLCLPCLLTLSLCLARWFWPDLMYGRHDHTTAVCVSLRWSGGLRVVHCLLDLEMDFRVGNMVFV